ARGQDEWEKIKSRQSPDTIVIEPGQKIERSFNLGDYYDLSQLDAGEYQVRVVSYVRYTAPLDIATFHIPLVSEPMSFTWPPSA
ncbi:hypothetical protein FRC11_003335, partial [Ceratobasidium sp. 423]